MPVPAPSTVVQRNRGQSNLALHVFALTVAVFVGIGQSQRPEVVTEFDRVRRRAELLAVASPVQDTTGAAVSAAGSQTCVP